MKMTNTPEPAIIKLVHKSIPVRGSMVHPLRLGRACPRIILDEDAVPVSGLRECSLHYDCIMIVVTAIEAFWTLQRSAVGLGEMRTRRNALVKINQMSRGCGETCAKNAPKINSGSGSIVPFRDHSANHHFDDMSRTLDHCSHLLRSATPTIS